MLNIDVIVVMTSALSRQVTWPVTLERRLLWLRSPWLRHDNVEFLRADEFAWDFGDFLDVVDGVFVRRTFVCVPTVTENVIPTQIFNRPGAEGQARS